MAYKRELRSITVARLRALLEGEDDDKQVIFSVDYGDHSHTQQALPIRGDVEESYVEESAYSHSGFALVDDDNDVARLRAPLGDDNDYDGEEGDKLQKYLLIR